MAAGALRPRRGALIVGGLRGRGQDERRHAQRAVTRMNDDLTPEERAALVAQIERLREEHRDLDAAIAALSDAGQAADRLQLQRLKKRKLMLRDKLARLEDRLTPDIIA